MFANYRPSKLAQKSVSPATSNKSSKTPVLLNSSRPGENADLHMILENTLRDNKKCNPYKAKGQRPDKQIPNSDLIALNYQYHTPKKR